MNAADQIDHDLETGVVSLQEHEELGGRHICGACGKDVFGFFYMRKGGNKATPYCGVTCLYLGYGADNVKISHHSTRNSE